MRTLFALPCVLLTLLTLGCGSNYRSDTALGMDKPTLRQQVERTTALMRRNDPGLERFFESAVGYVVFPKVTKGAVGVGAAHGIGEVFEGDEFIGRAELTQGSVGLQLGGQVYAEIIFFRDVIALENFKAGHLAFSGQASAVAVSSGAAATADYESDVAVFTLPTGGLMFEASIGGQGFNFIPLPK